MYFDVDFRFLETRSSNNQPEFPWTQIVLFYWFSYLHIHKKKNFQKFVQEKYKTLAVAFKSTFKYIDDVYLLTTEYQ